jgi:hypothetical protein
MYPPKVTDEQLRELIRELTIDGHGPSGRAVRTALKQRYGSRGGVGRIYRVLAAMHPMSASSSGSSHWAVVNEKLQQAEIQNLRQQVQAVKQQDDRHRAYWQWRIKELQLEVQKLKLHVHTGLGNAEAAGTALKEVQATELRTLQLQTLLRLHWPGTLPVPADG